MLYNIELEKIKEQTDCITCPYYNVPLKLCSGLNKVCFEYDPITQTAIDGITKLPININNN